MSEKKRILYVQTSGVDTPERTYAPLVLATTAASMGIDATVFFLGKGVTIVKTGGPSGSGWGRSRLLRTC